LRLLEFLPPEAVSLEPGEARRIDSRGS